VVLSLGSVTLGPAAAASGQAGTSGSAGAGTAIGSAGHQATAQTTATIVNPLGEDGDGSPNTQIGTAWYPQNAGLSPQTVTGGSFGQLFSTQLHGDIQAQPLVADGTLLVATEGDDAYGLDPVSGAVRWSRALGTPWNPADLQCDAAPTAGVTGTPVVASGVEYLVAKTYVSGTSGAAYYTMHALNVGTGAEQSGFPVRITGTASNDRTLSFDATYQLQRPGLVETGGVIYAAFGGACDHEPTHGWMVGVSTTGKLTTLWSDEAGSYAKTGLGGIWAPGALRSDGYDNLVFSTGNGYDPTTAASDASGATAPGKLGEAVVRVQIHQSAGSLVASDFFIPFDASHLNQNDGDLGSGAPVLLPPQYFTTPKHPRLAVEIGKEGYLYILDASHLGGYQQGPSGGDQVLARLGPVQGVWGDPAVWTGDGGYLYFVANGGSGAGIPGPTQGHLLAWRFGVDGAGDPTFAEVGQSNDSFAYGSSSPVVTSAGTTSGSSVLWVNWAPKEYSTSGQLRAYSTVPDSKGVLDLLWSAPTGQAAKLSTPGISGNRVYVGGYDGVIRAFGSPVSSPLSGGGLRFPNTTVGESSSQTARFTATETVTVSKVALSGSGFSLGTTTPALPVTLRAGGTLGLPVTFTPANAGENGGTITVTTSAGTYAVGLSGEGLSASAQLTVQPTFLSFEGTPVNTSVTDDVVFTNQGSQPLSISAATPPTSPFHVSGVPADGATLAPGASVGTVVTFAPITVGQFSSSFTLASGTGGSASVSLSGTSGIPAKMKVTPTSVAYGSIRAGTTKSMTFSVTNTGGTTLTILKSHPPAKGVFVTSTQLNEGSQLAPGASVTEAVVFTPTAAGSFSDVWTLNGSGNSTLTNVTFSGTAT
jgi:hypothetical protein